jgi:hypothetical protein
MEGFSDDFNWNSLKAASEEAERSLFVSEQKRIQNTVIEAMQNNQADAFFKFNSKLSISKQRVVLEELCKRFPGRVWSKTSGEMFLHGTGNRRLQYDPRNPNLGGSEFGINLL